MSRLRAFSALALLCVASCRKPAPTDPRIIAEWTKYLYGAVRVERLSPAVASRLYAYMSIGMYAGLAAADPSLPSLDDRLTGIPKLPRGKRGEGYDPTLTLIATERTLSDSLFRDGLPTTRAALAGLADSLAEARLAFGVSSNTKARSEKLGRETALALLTWAHKDGFDTTRGKKYVIPVGRGLWVNDSTTTTYSTQNLSGASQLVVPSNPTNAGSLGSSSDRGLILDRRKPAGPTTLAAANMAGVTEPYWGFNRPFALKSWDECPAQPPPPYDEKPGTPLYEQAKHVYEVRKTLTPEQRNIALYWADNGGETGTPAGHWLSIGGQLVSERGLSANEAAWMLAATGAAIADAFIAAWGYKFKLNVVRPRTFIRATMDKNWEPAIPTPPFPEFLSGHSTVSSAAAATLTGFLGTTAFVDSTSMQIGHDVRRFDSFQAAAEEAGLSRIYGGIHYPIANTAGQELGRCVAQHVLARFDNGKFLARTK
jgi:membrane-associated phospholipid phosphatase